MDFFSILIVLMGVLVTGFLTIGYLRELITSRKSNEH